MKSLKTILLIELLDGIEIYLFHILGCYKDADTVSHCYNVTAAGLLLQQTVVSYVVHRFEPFVALLSRRTDVGGEMLEP